MTKNNLLIRTILANVQPDNITLVSKYDATEYHSSFGLEARQNYTAVASVKNLPDSYFFSPEDIQSLVDGVKLLRHQYGYLPLIGDFYVCVNEERQFILGKITYALGQEENK